MRIVKIHLHADEVGLRLLQLGQRWEASRNGQNPEPVLFNLIYDNSVVII